MLLLAAHPDGSEVGGRNETCDDCADQLWINDAGADVMDEAEDEGRIVVMLCARCGVRRYGEPFVRMVLESQQAKKEGETV